MTYTHLKFNNGNKAKATFLGSLQAFIKRKVSNQIINEIGQKKTRSK